MTTRPYFRTIDDVKSWDNARGGKFFHPENMRFANSRVHDRVYAGRYFVTSEQDRHGAWDYRRRYTIREVTDCGTIRSVTGLGDADDSEAYGRYATSRGAHEAAARLADERYPYRCPYCQKQYATVEAAAGCRDADIADQRQRTEQHARWVTRVRERAALAGLVSAAKDTR